jgi:hypothetical protein
MMEITAIWMEPNVGITHQNDFSNIRKDGSCPCCERPDVRTSLHYTEEGVLQMAQCDFCAWTLRRLERP